MLYGPYSAYSTSVSVRRRALSMLLGHGVLRNEPLSVCEFPQTFLGWKSRDLADFCGNQSAVSFVRIIVVEAPLALRERGCATTIARIWPARSRPRSPAQAAVHRLSRLQPSRAPGSRPPSAASWLAPPRVSERWLAGACSWHSSCWRTPRAPAACGRARHSSGSLSTLAGARAHTLALPSCPTAAGC